MVDKSFDTSGARGFVDRWAATSPGLRSELFKYALALSAAYKVSAPRRSGHLASSVVPGTAWSSYGRKRRPVGTVTVRAYYAVWNLTGAGPGMHRRSTGRQPKFGPFRGSYTFGKIVGELRGGKYM